MRRGLFEKAFGATELLPELFTPSPIHLIVLGVAMVIPALLETSELLWMGEIDWTLSKRVMVCTLGGSLIFVGVVWAVVRLRFE